MLLSIHKLLSRYRDSVRYTRVTLLTTHCRTTPYRGAYSLVILSNQQVSKRGKSNYVFGLRVMYKYYTILFCHTIALESFYQKGSHPFRPPSPPLVNLYANVTAKQAKRPKQSTVGPYLS